MSDICNLKMMNDDLKTLISSSMISNKIPSITFLFVMNQFKHV